MRSGRSGPGAPSTSGRATGATPPGSPATGWQVTAVDFSGVAIERGRARAEAGGLEVDWQLADLLEWTPEARAYDLVTLFFIHLPREERRAVYARAADAVAIGGTLLVVAHDKTNPSSGTGGPQDPDVLVSPAEVAAELACFPDRPGRDGATKDCRTAAPRSTRSCGQSGSPRFTC